MKEFLSYVDDLVGLLTCDDRDPVEAVLDGAVSKELRSRIALDLRRSKGAFFTSQELALRLVADEVTSARVVVDPAAGCGDLLLAAARTLPLRSTVRATLSSWGRVLYGSEVEEAFVRITRIRLALLASYRLRKRARLNEQQLGQLLPHIVVADGQSQVVPMRSVILLNPPYGACATVKAIDWATGATVSRAALFTASVIERSPAGTRLAAILPDVLRSGTNYNRWRNHVRSLLEVEAVEPIGVFDPFTDIDVFVLRGCVRRGQLTTGDPVPWFATVADGQTTINDRFQVNVGSVVPFRNPHQGRLVRYLTAHDLPLGGEFDTSKAPTRRYSGRRFTPPFVLVRRTSRPGQVTRAAGTIVRGSSSVAIENHLLICTPRDGTGETCLALQRVLSSETTDKWLNDRIRCRHLTVGALRELPWRER